MKIWSYHTIFLTDDIRYCVKTVSMNIQDHKVWFSYNMIKVVSWRWCFVSVSFVICDYLCFLNEFKSLEHYFLESLFELVIVYFFFSVEKVYTSIFSCILVLKSDKKNCCTLFFELTYSRNKLIINENKVFFNYTCCPSFLHVLSFVDAGLVLFFLPLC